MNRRRTFVIGYCWFCCCLVVQLMAETSKTMTYCNGPGDTNCLPNTDDKNLFDTMDFNRFKLCPSDRKLFETQHVSSKTKLSEFCPVLIEILKSNRNQSSDCLFPVTWSISSSATAALPVTTVAKTASAVATATDLLTTLPLNDDGVQDQKNTIEDKSSLKVWTYSFMAVTLINLCGLFGLAVIPITNKPYYEHLLQFFVALAVGTLCGDALLHLLPHAIESHSGHGHDHNHDHQHQHHHDNEPNHHGHNHDTIWKGFVVMVSIVAFFFIEKFAMFCSEWRNRKQRRANQISRVKVMHEGDNVNIVGEKLCKHKYSSFPYCYDDIAVKRMENSCMEKCRNETEICTLGPMGDKIKPETDAYTKNLLKNDFGSGSIAAVTNSVSGAAAAAAATAAAATATIDCGSNGTNSILKPLKNGVDYPDDGTITGTTPTLEDGPLNRETYTVIIREHENKHHGHSHTHVHVHSAPKNLSSVAWMVIMGDGLHNFTDGVAIGAAFTSSITGGFSTTFAVFCHELPHELGDFAVLLKAGMSAKEAFCYSLLSSILCYVGMLFGIALGNFDRGNKWTFAVTAGSFLYIALVDLIPELSSSHLSETGSVIKSLLQLAGISCGLLIMTLIAIYEDTLITVFT